MRELIHHFFGTLNVQLAVLPEFISFLCGRKKIVRIIVDQSDQVIDIPLLQKYGFYTRETSLYTTKSSNSYSCMVTSTEGFGINELTEICMYSISKSAVDLEDFENCELYGDSEKAGFYLGYPKCCVENLEKVNAIGAKWGIFYLEDFISQKKASLFCNRFPISWGGISIVGELFPCSINCKAARMYAEAMLTDVQNFGFEKIKDKILDHSQRPVFINKQNGEISVSQNAGFEQITFT